MRCFFSSIRFSFIFTGLMLLFITAPVFGAGQNELRSSEDVDFPLFNAPKTDAEILRRDSEGSSRGRSRSMMTRRTGELTRGLIRGKDMEKKEVPVPSHIIPLVPETVGLTSKTQPALFWYVSDSWPEKMEFRLNAFKAEEPLVDTHITGPSSEGIYRIDLADYDVTLKPGVEYDWFLTIVFDENDRSADYFISGTIIYSPLSDDVSRHLANTSEDRLYAVYAGSGYWYDAMDHLSRQIDLRPEDASLRRYRAKLLEQVNLPKIAAYDIQQISK